MRFKVGDTVEVMAGDDRGQRGRVLSVDRGAGKLIVEGVNLVYKHVRRSQRNPQGGRLSKEMPICASNVLLVCEKCGAGTRLGVRYADDGAKMRFCKRCGSDTGQLAPAKPAYAKVK
jgi:large subunit ribosomal protein L24